MCMGSRVLKDRSLAVLRKFSLVYIYVSKQDRCLDIFTKYPTKMRELGWKYGVAGLEALKT